MKLLTSVAIIGSFRQHYENVLQAWSKFTSIGIEVTSPKGTHIVEKGIPFVRFASDSTFWDDPMVQTVALHRILRASFVYVVAPDGYVGRTTCYEIGRIIQCQRPLYFSQQPKDLPLIVPPNHVHDVEAILEQIQSENFMPTPLFCQGSTPQEILELDLLKGKFRADDEI